MLSRLAQCFAGATLYLFVLLAPAEAQNLVPVPTLKARVTDLTGSLSADQVTRLEQKLATFEVRKGSQIAVLIVATTQPETIDNIPYAWPSGGSWAARAWTTVPSC
jgi:uncharacterized protein